MPEPALDRGGVNPPREPPACAGRVLFLTHAGDPGGAELKMIDLCRALRSRCEVMLFQHGPLEEMLRNHRIAVSVRPMGASARNFRRAGNPLGILRALPGALSMIGHVARKGRHFDAVVCFSQKSFVFAALAKPLLRRPILWFMNDILSQAHFSRTLIGMLVALSRRADHIAVNSGASLAAWIEAGGRRDRTSVIYPGVQDEQIATLQDTGRIAQYRRRYSPQARPLVGMFGRIDRWKGQDVFLKAIAQVPEVQGLIVGGALFAHDEYRREIHRLTEELGLADRVTFAGHLQDVMTVMAACDVIAHCSTRPEPFGLVIVEAMLAGTPVIASDAGGAREIVIPNETGQLTPLNDPAALAAAIRRCLADPRWAREMADRAATRARQQFSGVAMTSGFLEALATL